MNHEDIGLVIDLVAVVVLFGTAAWIQWKTWKLWRRWR